MKSLVTNACFFLATAVAIVAFIGPTLFAEEQNAAKANPSPAESVTARVDKLFAEWNRSDSPGCSLAISQNGVLVYERGYGMANLELGVAIRPASVFHVASISKQFTAMSLLLLVQRGQLSLDDEARKYITELPDFGSRLTIRHLLTHTSGLREAFSLQGMAAPREDGADRNDALVKILARQRALNFAPGAEFQYNNGGYAMLASIVKRVSGQPLRAFTDANIFKPLGMTHTHFHDDPTMIVPNRASGYHQGSGAFHRALRADPNGIVGNAGLFTTARDLLLWEQNFADVRVGDPALVAEMQKPAVPTGWSDTSYYGFGLEVGRYRGLRTIGHGGGDQGYGAYVVRYPDQGFAVAVLGNLDNIGSAVGRLTQGVADIYLADVLAASSASNATAIPPTVSLSAEQLASKAGLYRDPSTEAVGRIFVRDDMLIASADDTEGEGVELTPVSANRFVISGTTIRVEFVPAAGGRAQETRVTGTGLKPIVSQKLDPFAPPSAELRAFAGEYTSPELEVTYTLAARDSGLVVQMKGRSDGVLRPIFPDAFAGTGGSVLKFSRDARGIVTGFTLNSSGVRGLRFDRVKP
jgi:CubicO group peptidase (beta-lactamase class C family)